MLALPQPFGGRRPGCRFGHPGYKGDSLVRQQGFAAPAGRVTLVIAGFATFFSPETRGQSAERRTVLAIAPLRALRSARYETL